jgi:hypothetical protein
MHKHIRTGIALFSLLVAVAVAQAGKPKTLQAEFSGQVLVSSEPLQLAGETEADMIATVRKARIREVAKHGEGDETSWSFQFTAFLDKAPRTSELSLDVYTAEGTRRYLTSKRMMGIDPKARILAGDMTLTAEDGVKPRTKVKLELTGKVGNREVTFATSTLTLR